MQQEREEWEEIGWKKGWEEGETVGREASEKAGRAEEAARFSKLIKHLLSTGRTEDLDRAASDEELREHLYKELGI